MTLQQWMKQRNQELTRTLLRLLTQLAPPPERDAEGSANAPAAATNLEPVVNLPVTRRVERNSVPRSNACLVTKLHTSGQVKVVTTHLRKIGTGEATETQRTTDVRRVPTAARRRIAVRTDSSADAGNASGESAQEEPLSWKS